MTKQERSPYQPIFKEALERSLKPPQINEVRSSIIKLINEGHPKEILLDELGHFYGGLEKDQEIEVVLVVLDQLSGWCNPDIKIG